MGAKTGPAAEKAYAIKHPPISQVANMAVKKTPTKRLLAYQAIAFAEIRKTLPQATV